MWINMFLATDFHLEKEDVYESSVALAGLCSKGPQVAQASNFFFWVTR